MIKYKKNFLRKYTLHIFSFDFIPIIFISYIIIFYRKAYKIIN